MKLVKTAITVTLILALSLSAVAGIASVNFAVANFVGTYVEEGGEVPPEIVGAAPPIITILSPTNNTYGPNVSLNFNISVGDSAIPTSRTIKEVYYKGDWEQNKTYVGLYLTDFSCNLTVPEGKHRLTVWANEAGDYEEDTGSGYNGLERIVFHTFHITGSSSVSFTVDSTSPNVSVLSVENKTYGTSEVQLDFTVNELVSQITYSLDGQDNVTFAGNSTLTGLLDGEHSITVYASDIAGNIGASETIYFSVKVSSPTTLVLASVASVGVVGTGLLVYFKRRKHFTPKQTS